MQIKRFQAASMKEALELVKREFGPDAVILSARTLEARNGLSRFVRGPRVELTAATDRGERPRDREKDAAPERVSGSFVKALGRAAQEADSHPRREKRQARASKRLFSLFQQLLLQGVEEGVALDVITRMDKLAGGGELSTEDGARSALHQAMRVLGVSARRLRIEPNMRQFVAFVGPTGSGKTTTAAKFAAACMLRRNADWIGLITLDNDRIGSVEQLRIYARILGVPLERAWSRESLSSALGRLEGRELVLVDTPGITKGNMNLFRESMELLHVMAPLQTMLVVSATTQLSDLKGYRGMLDGIPIAGFIFTKLDETTSYGNILSELVCSGIPLCYTTNSQNAPGGIEVGKLERLSELLLNAETEERIGSLPPEVLAANWARLDSAMEEARPVGVIDLSAGVGPRQGPDLLQYERKVAYAV